MANAGNVLDSGGVNWHAKRILLSSLKEADLFSLTPPNTETVTKTRIWQVLRRDEVSVVASLAERPGRGVRFFFGTEPVRVWRNWIEGSPTRRLSDAEHLEFVRIEKAEGVWQVFRGVAGELQLQLTWCIRRDKVLGDGSLFEPSRKIVGVSNFTDAHSADPCITNSSAVPVGSWLQIMAGGIRLLVLPSEACHGAYVRLEAEDGRMMFLSRRTQVRRVGAPARSEKSEAKRSEDPGTWQAWASATWEEP